MDEIMYQKSYFDFKRELDQELNKAADTAVNIFIHDCLNMAKENWCNRQVDMLETLFESVKNGYEYRCIKCSYFGRAGDAPSCVPKECMWVPGEEDGWNKPCEEE